MGKNVKVISYFYDAEGKANGRSEMLFDEAGKNVIETVYYDAEGNVVRKVPNNA